MDGHFTCTAARRGSTDPRRARAFWCCAGRCTLTSLIRRRSRYVAGLRSADFAVYEDGVRQEVRFFESNALPIDLIVLLDTSTSMHGKMNVVRHAAIGFLSTLRKRDRGAVVAFNDTVTVLQPLTNDRVVLERAVKSARADGYTALYTALHVALEQFGLAARNGEAVRRQAIAVVSDGQDNSSLVPFDEVLALARQKGVNVYTVGLRSELALPRSAATADYEMTTLARETGGLSFFPTPDRLRAIYSSIARELASQYSIGYEPANGHVDGRFRRVAVQVVSRPDLHPRTREGYTGCALGSISDRATSVPR